MKVKSELKLAFTGAYWFKNYRARMSDSSSTNKI